MYKQLTKLTMSWLDHDIIYSVTCQLLVVFPAVFDQFSSQFAKEDNSVGFKIF